MLSKAPHRFLRFASGAVLAAQFSCGTRPPPSARSNKPATPIVEAPPWETAAASPKVRSQTPVWSFQDPDREERIQAALAEVGAFVGTESAKLDLPGLSFGLVVDGELVLAQGYGSVRDGETEAPTADTVYRIASITKPFTALAVLQLRDEGKLSLDDPLEKYLPEARGIVYPTRDSRSITLRQLLTHTSGVPAFVGFPPAVRDAGPTEHEVLQALSGLELHNAPDLAFEYSNFGYAALGLVIQKTSGRPYRDYITAEILVPLGMRDTVWTSEDVPTDRLAPGYRRAEGKWTEATWWHWGGLAPAAGLNASVADMAKFIALQLDAYPPRNEADGLVNRSSIRQSHLAALSSADLRVGYRDDPSRPRLWGTTPAYGFGWGVYDTCELDFLVSHSGGTNGYSTTVSFLPEYGIGAVSLTNAEHVNLGPLTARVLEELIVRADLGKRKLEPTSMSEPFTLAMERLMSVYDHWDPDAYAAMLAKGRAPMSDERRELENYRRLHGACSGYRAIAVEGLSARFALKCERGDLEMALYIDPDDRLIHGFSGTSRNIPAPASATSAAKDVLSLLAQFNAALYKRRWQKTDDVDGLSTSLQSIRDGHGTCTLGDYSRQFDTDEFVLQCASGGPVVLSITMAEPDNPDPSGKIATMKLAAAPSTHNCPVK